MSGQGRQRPEPRHSASRPPGWRANARAIALLCLLLPLGGCGLLRSIGLLPSPPPPVQPPGATPPPPPADYLLAVTLSATPDINPDPSGRASPLRVHVYVDERDPHLRELGFAAVFGAGPSGAASASGSASEPLATLVLAPGQSTELALTPRTDDVWVSVAAAYREPWSALWADSVRVDGSGTAGVRARFERDALRVSREPGS